MDMMSERVEIEPSSFEEPMRQPLWAYSMVEEYDSIIINNVWEVVPRVAGESMVISKWIYKVKKVADGSVDKHNARFVARGFS